MTKGCFSLSKCVLDKFCQSNKAIQEPSHWLQSSDSQFESAFCESAAVVMHWQNGRALLKKLGLVRQGRWLIWHHFLLSFSPKRLLWSRLRSAFCIFIISTWEFQSNSTVGMIHPHGGRAWLFDSLKKKQRKKNWERGGAGRVSAELALQGPGRQQEVRSCRFLLMSFQEQCRYCRSPFHFSSVSPWAEMRIGFKLSIAPLQSPLGPRKNTGICVCTHIHARKHKCNNVLESIV